MALIDQYLKEELEKIVNQSNSLREVILKLGYSSSSGSNSATVKKRLKKYNISTDHFNFVKGIQRTEKNIFIKDSTAVQSVLRKWYSKNKYTEYKCSICGQEPFWNGQELTLILDHINGINNDDRLENLRWVCPNCNQQLPTTGYKKMRTENKLQKKYYCIDCGVEISRNATRCVSCTNKMNYGKAAKSQTTREELKKLIRTKPFTQIGEQFGITDNAIRRWCDVFSLPRTKKEIQKYSDAEWENI